MTQGSVQGAEGTAPPGLLSDAPTEQDRFGRAHYADVLAEVAAVRSETPLVIAVYGSWGSGKTSLMYQVRRRLDPNFDHTRPDLASEARARTGWCEPWMHQFDQVPAIGLLHAVTNQLGLAAKSEVTETL